MKEENTPSGRIVIAAINQHVSELPISNILFQYADKYCQDGNYAPYSRLIYKASTEREFEKLSVLFSDLNAQYLASQKSGKRVLPYKNSPIFLSGDIRSATLKTNKAFKAYRFLTDGMKGDCSQSFPILKTVIFADNQEEFKKDLRRVEASYLELSRTIFDSTEACISLEVETIARSVTVYLNVADLEKWLVAQEIAFNKISVRRFSGIRYQVRFVDHTPGTINKDHSMGVIILHPSCSLTKKDICTVPPRKLNLRAVEMTMTRIEQIHHLSLMNADWKFWYGE